MEPAFIKEDNTLLENYLGLIKNLSREYKTKLVNSLNHDIGKPTSPSNDWIDRLYGAFFTKSPLHKESLKIGLGKRFKTP